MKSGLAFNCIQEAFSRTYGFTTGQPAYPLRDALLEELAELSPRNILDVGCGTGCFAMHDQHYTGIDPNPDYIAYCRRFRPGKYQEMSGTVLKFPPKSFHVVICFSVGHHLPNHTFLQLCRQVARVLDDDGVFLFADAVRPIASWPWAARMLEFIDRGAFFRTQSEYRQLLQREFHIQGQRELVEQFYRTILLRCQKL